MSNLLQLPTVKAGTNYKRKQKRNGKKFNCLTSLSLKLLTLSLLGNFEDNVCSKFPLESAEKNTKNVNNQRNKEKQQQKTPKRSLKN